MSERSNEEQLDLFADLLEPASEIIADREFRDMLQSKEPPIRAVRQAIKNHKQAIITILALLDGVPVEDYRVNILTLPARLLILLNKPEVQELFTSQGQKTEDESSGSATENTRDGVD